MHEPPRSRFESARVSPADPGAVVVERVRRALAPDARWSESIERGFAWWPHRLAQRVRADPVRVAGGRAASRVHVEVELLSGVRGTGTTFAALSAWQARSPSLAALRWDAERESVTLRSAVTVVAAGEERGGALLAHAALLQLGESLRVLAALGESVGGAAADSSPPTRGSRETPDPLVAAAEVYAEHGRTPSPITREALLALAALPTPPWRRVHVEGGTLNAELPAGADGTAPAILRLTGSQAHPELGSGLLAVLSPPANAEPVPERLAATAALLNEGEAREWTGCDQLGGWCVHPSLGLVFASFVPALCVRGGLLEHVAWTHAARARWAASFLTQVGGLRA